MKQIIQLKMWNADETEIRTVGSESGIIILDLEYSDGARISLEKETSIAPFANAHNLL